MTREELLRQLEDAETELREAINDTSWRTGAEGPDAEYYEMLRYERHKQIVQERRDRVEKLKEMLNSL